MSGIKFKRIAVPKIFQKHVDTIIVREHNGETNPSTNVYLNAIPGIVFQHNNGRSPIDNITTSPSYRDDIPTLFVYGQMTEPSVVSYKKEPFTTTQIFLSRTNYQLC